MKYLIIIATLFLVSCNSQKISKTINSDDYQSAEQPYYQEWTGGAPNSGSGVTLYFPTSIMEGHTLKAVYFRGMENNIARFISNDKQMLVSRFQFPLVPYNMDVNSQNEYGNQPPELEEIPFKLLDNEAVIAFEANGKTKYVKITNIAIKETVAFPSAPPRGDQD